MTSVRSDKVRILMVFLAATLGAGCAPRTDDSVVVRVGATEVSQLLAKQKSGTLFIDARPVDDFRVATIPGAVHLKLSDLEEGKFDARLERYSGFVIFGQNPGSGAPVAIAKRMIATGYEGVTLFESGFDAWVAGGGGVAPGVRFGPPER